jgi:hypoxanthine phosphoribosyltransferase
MKTLIEEQPLRQGIERWSGQIRDYYQGKPVTLVGVMMGSLMVLGDLVRRLDEPTRVQMILARRRPRGDGPGPLAVDVELLEPEVRGRHVLLVDDIFDTGNTLFELVPQIDELGPASVRSAVLVRKQGRSRVAMKPDFVAFDIPDAFVVGYGLDYRDRYRNLPYLAALEPDELR